MSAGTNCEKPSPWSSFQVVEQANCLAGITEASRTLILLYAFAASESQWEDPEAVAAMQHLWRDLVTADKIFTRDDLARLSTIAAAGLAYKKEFVWPAESAASNQLQARVLENLARERQRQGAAELSGFARGVKQRISALVTGGLSRNNYDHVQLDSLDVVLKEEIDVTATPQFREAVHEHSDLAAAAGPLFADFFVAPGVFEDKAVIIEVDGPSHYVWDMETGMLQGSLALVFIVKFFWTTCGSLIWAIRFLPDLVGMLISL